jgi:hypothetical protein
MLKRIIVLTGPRGIAKQAYFAEQSKNSTAETIMSMEWYAARYRKEEY